MTALKPAAKKARALQILKDKSFCEFFAGIGLVRDGLAASGWRCVYANDIDEKKTHLYKARFGNCDHFHLADVWNTAEVVDRIVEAPFLATASFPCIDLSLAGHWRGFKGEHSSTFFGFVDVIKALRERQPALVMLENVSGFITSHDGADFATAVKTLAKLGYWMDSLIVDAKYFVPQSRPRVFVIAVHEQLRPSAIARSKQRSLFGDSDSNVAPSGPLRSERLVNLMRSTKLATGWLHFELPTPTNVRSPLSELIDTDDLQEWWDEKAVRKHYEMMSERHVQQVDLMLANGGTHIGTIFRRKRYGKTRAEIRFDGLAGCLRTPRGGSARQIVIVIQKGQLRMRWMSPREYARLQGAGDYPLIGKTNQQLFGFGDAVCVPVIRWIDENILSKVFENSVNGRGASVAG